MVSKAWRVRFAPLSKSSSPQHHQVNSGKTLDRSPPQNLRQPRSKSACQECKLRRVKCDETFPSCRRCDRRGLLCVPAPRKTVWRMELPFVIQQASIRDDKSSSALLQYWFERVCHIMALDPDLNNPMALPLLAFVRESPGLLHTIQSIAAAHKSGFHGVTDECLVERKRSLSSIQQELVQVHKHPVHTFLSIFLLGISSPWIERTVGLEHMMGARAVLDLVLSDPSADLSDPAIQLIVGLYIWWEMAASFHLEPRLQKSLNTDIVHRAVHASRLKYHPLTGYYLDLFYTLANLNHYCRRLVDGEARDLVVEAILREEMLEWKPSQGNELSFLLGDAYRKHGLIQLHRICGPDPEKTEAELEQQIQGLSAGAMTSLLEIPLSSPYLILQPIPLLSAASEIPAHDVERCEEAKRRFRAIYSLTKLPVMLDAVALLEEVWGLRALGITSSWLVIVHERGQIFPLA